MKKVIVFLPFPILVFVLLSMGPVPTPNEDNVEKVSGVVSEIYKAGSNDIVFKLLDDDHFYYIKEGAASYPDYKQLKKDLLYKDVEISYVKHWSLLNASGSARSMCQLKVNNEIVYTALNDNLSY